MARHRSPAVDILAAGGVVWRRHDGRTEVLLVHRPRYDDWSLPKGKLEDGETELAAAVREVAEETGAQVAVSRRLRPIHYPVGPDRKQVFFWVMRHRSGSFEPNSEVDEVRWLDVPAARELLSYDVERRVLDEFAELPLPEAQVLLVRHAHAGKRSDWKGPDNERPLDKRGQDQAERLVGLLQAFAPTALVSAQPVRCVQTVTPLAEAEGLSITVEPAFDDGASAANEERTAQTMLRLAHPGSVTVIASQGGTIPALVERFAPGVESSDTRKSAAWSMSLVDGEVVSCDYYEDAIR